MRVLIASCIRQEPHILKEFLIGLDELEKPENTDFYFILHNCPVESIKMVSDWADNHEPSTTLRLDSDDTQYVRDDRSTHIWKKEAIDAVISRKNEILDYAMNEEYDCLFLTDSDQVYHPKTLLHLIERDRDVVGEISWARWRPEDPEMPNAWFEHPYQFMDGDMDKLLNQKGIHKVAGFGGCYLLSRQALGKGVAFNRYGGYPNDWGEDRYFHIRAKALGFDSYIDTTYPYFHIYRDSDLLRLRDWKENNYEFKEVEVQRGSVLIAVPIGETWIHPDLTTWLIKTLKKNPDWGLEIHRMHPIDSNRNAIVKKFMTLPEGQRFEWLAFVDSDVVPPVNGVKRLLWHGKKLLGGVCFIMGNDGVPIPNISKDIESGHHKPELIEVKGMGMGFMLIHRDVLTDVGQSPFRFRYDDWGMATVCGEDYDFCEKAVNAGYTVYADLAVQCGHYKQVDLTTLNKQLGELLSRDKRVS